MMNNQGVLHYAVDRGSTIFNNVKFIYNSLIQMAQKELSKFIHLEIQLTGGKANHTGNFL